MTKFKYALTSINLAKLGVYDDFHELYDSIVSIYEDIFERSDNTDSGLIFGQNEEPKKEVRKLIDVFLKDNTYIFSDNYKWLHPNVLSMNWLQIVDAEHDRPLHITFKIITFREFLERLQDSVSIIIWNRMRYEKSKISQEYVFHMVNGHISLLVNEMDKKICCSKNKDIINVKRVIVFKKLSSISCKQNNHRVVCERIKVPLIEKNEVIMLPIHKCLDCDKKFIGNETLRIYEKIYGKMLLDVRKDDCIGNTPYEFLNESKLHQTGYNVIEGKLSERERRGLLVKLLETDTLTYFEICSDIEKAINLFKYNPKFVKAVSKWNSDLLFISEYIKNK